MFLGTLTLQVTHLLFANDETGSGRLWNKHLADSRQTRTDDNLGGRDFTCEETGLRTTQLGSDRTGTGHPISWFLVLRPFTSSVKAVLVTSEAGGNHSFCHYFCCFPSHFLPKVREVN